MRLSLSIGVLALAGVLFAAPAAADGGALEKAIELSAHGRAAEAKVLLERQFTEALRTHGKDPFPIAHAYDELLWPCVDLECRQDRDEVRRGGAMPRCMERACLSSARAWAIQRATEAIGAGKPFLADALLEMGDLTCIGGDHDGSEDLVERALEIRRSLGADTRDALDALLKIEVARGDAKRAADVRAKLVASNDPLARAVFRFGSEDTKVRALRRDRQSMEETIALHTRLFPRSPDAAALALSMVLQRKGRAVDVMAGAFGTLRREASGEGRAVLDELAGVRARIAARTLHGGAMDAAARADLDALRAEQSVLELKASALAKEAGDEIRPVAIDDVRAALPEGAALVEIVQYRPIVTFLRMCMPPTDEDLDAVDALIAEESEGPARSGPSRSGGAATSGAASGDPEEEMDRALERFREPARYEAYVVRRDGPIAWADLGDAASIDAAIVAFRGALKTGSPAVSAAARTLDERVMRPIRALLGPERRVVLSPDGALSLVPFEAFADEDGRWLVERWSFTYVASGRDLLASGAPAADGPIEVIADPAFGVWRPHTLSDRRAIDLAKLEFVPLPGTRAEADAIARTIAGVDLHVGDDASEARIKSVHRPRILHIATHGYFLPETQAPSSAGSSAAAAAAAPVTESPLLRAGLAFAGANTGGAGAEDGVLTALEASSLDLTGTELVVLSACETGLGDALPGDGVYGMRRAFSLAGAQAILMSLWDVSDSATTELMSRYYAGLRDGAARSDALRSAQLEMLAQPSRRHPFFWAGFILSGQGGPLHDKLAVPPGARVAPSPRGCACESAGEGAPSDRSSLAALVAFCALATLVRLAARRSPAVAARMP